MASEPIRRRIEPVLDAAEDAISIHGWDLVRDRAQSVLAIDPGHNDGIDQIRITSNIASDLDPSWAVIAEVDLTLTKTASPDPVSVGENLAYTIVVTEGAADSDTATNVVLTDELPDDVSYVSATPTQGTCSEAGCTVTRDLDSIEPEACATVDIVVTPVIVSSITNTARVAWDVLDPIPGAIEASTTTTVQGT